MLSKRNCLRLVRAIVIPGLVFSATASLADGMVVPQVFFPKVEIPNQEALIHFSDGLERLVIETSFMGEGTNFAWVVPLPSEPEVKPVSTLFFNSLRQSFRPRLIHEVHPYYAGVLFLCGLAFLGWRSFKDEVSGIKDLPLCLLLAAGAGLLGKHVLYGFFAGGLALWIRFFARSPANLAFVMLFGTAFAACLIFVPRARGWGLVQTLGATSAAADTEPAAGVRVLAVQRAGVFDATTIQATSPDALREWLENNGYSAPKSAETAIRQYVDQGWVFVASKVRRDAAASGPTALHPLSFTFRARAPVYPTRLTAIENGDCAIDLYVFGRQRAIAHGFHAVRCDRVGTDMQTSHKRATSRLWISDPEILALIGNSTTGTKLSARLTPQQMSAEDVVLKSGAFWKKGAHVYSYSGALAIALNLVLPLAALGWLLVGASRGGWNVDEAWISRWRRRLLAASLGVGLGVFLLLPKVEIVSRSVAAQDEARLNPHPPTPFEVS